MKFAMSLASEEFQEVQLDPLQQQHSYMTVHDYNNYGVIIRRIREK